MAGDAVDEHDVTTRRSKRRDGGFSLAENLVAISLMGTVIMVIIGAMWSSVRISQFSDDQAKVEAVLGGAVDALGSVAFQPCPVVGGVNKYEEFAQIGAGSVDGWAPSTVKITSMQWWDPIEQDWTYDNGIGDAVCASTAFMSTAKTMQLLTVTVTTPNGEYSRSIDVIITDLRSKKVGNG